jgi:hypothetical protein
LTVVQVVRVAAEAQHQVSLELLEQLHLQIKVTQVA